MFREALAICAGQSGGIAAQPDTTMMNAAAVLSNGSSSPPMAIGPTLAPVAGDGGRAPGSSTATVSFAELVAHRPYLVRFALRKLRDPALAEDAVHDVMEAVLSGRARFGGRAAFRSWLTAVLKHKIVDVLRDSHPHESLDGDDDESGERPGHALASTAPTPEQLAAQREELAQALAGIDRLPPTLREAMRLRVVEDLPTAAVCAELGISEENLFVRVHRARRQLLS